MYCTVFLIHNVSHFHLFYFIFVILFSVGSIRIKFRHSFTRKHSSPFYTLKLKFVFSVTPLSWTRLLVKRKRRLLSAFLNILCVLVLTRLKLIFVRRLQVWWKHQWSKHCVHKIEWLLTFTIRHFLFIFGEE